MKKGLTTILTLATATVMGLSIFGGCSSASADLSGYVALDINPSVEFLTDKDGKVASVRAVNEDAMVLLSDLDLKGKDIKIAVKIVAESCEEIGFINEANADVSITVGGANKEAEEKLTELAEQGVEQGSQIAVIKADEIKVALEAELERIKENSPVYAHLTAAKLKIINSIMELDETFTVEQGNGMTMKQLIKYLDELYDEMEEVYEDEIEAAVEAKISEWTNNVKEQIDAKLDEIYGAGFAAKQALLQKLEELEDKFEKVITEQTLGKHHFHFGRDFDFDAEDELLTQDMIDEINAVLQAANIDGLTEFIATVGVTTLNDFEEWFETNVEEVLEEIVENADLSAIQQGILNGLKAQLKAIERQAIEAIKPVINEWRETHKEALKDWQLDGGHHANRPERPTAPELNPAPVA